MYFNTEVKLTGTMEPKLEASILQAFVLRLLIFEMWLNPLRLPIWVFRAGPWLGPLRLLIWVFLEASNLGFS